MLDVGNTHQKIAHHFSRKLQQKR